MRYLQLLVSVFFLITTLNAATFTSPKDSPLAKGEHPRLFFTANGIAKLRAKIQTYYQPDFQKFIDHIDALYHTSPKSGILDEWNDLFGAARAYALLYQVDPATINGIRAGHTKTDYGRKAIELALYLSQELSSSWGELHHGARNLTTGDGGLATLALQVVYDWTHDLATLEERRAIADRLIILWENKYDSDKVKLENHYAANTHVYAGALCFYGDSDLGVSYMSKAQIMMDSFQDVFIERQLGVAERLFEGSSDWIEGDFYSMDGYLGIGFLAAAASSALGENFFITNPWLHYAPYYLYYNTVPMAYKGVYYYSQHNTSSVLSSEESHPTQLLNMVAAQIYETDPDLAGFAAWYCEESPYGLDVEDYKYYKPHIFDFFYKFVFGTKHIPKKTADDANVALSFKLGQSHVIRSDHSVNDATMIQFYSFKYWYPNGHNEPEQGAINIHRFGPLAVAASNTKNSGDGIPRVQSGGKGMAMNNVFGLGGDNSLAVEMPSTRVENADLPADFVDGAPAHVGTVEAREYWENEWDYIDYNYSRSYSAGEKASRARRALVYWRGPVNSEYIVVMDRVNSEREKYFVLHTPVDIEAVDGNWSSAGSGHWTSNAKTAKVTNTIDQAHGQMYVASVFPQQATLHKFGGNGYEWVWADGTPLDYSSSDFTEKASYLFGDHTLQIRSWDNYFLTVIKIGDAHTMAGPPLIERLSGNNWSGALIDKTRLNIFSNSETKLQGLSYTIESNFWVKHLVTELDIRREYTVFENGKEYVSGITAATGRAFFYSFPNGRATYKIQLGGATSVSQPEDVIMPQDFELTNYPNPFSMSATIAKSGTTISFSLPQAATISLAIYNTAGQLVRKLASGNFKKGKHNLRWDGKSANGFRLASGVYFYRLQANGRPAVQKKLILMK